MVSRFSLAVLFMYLNFDLWTVFFIKRSESMTVANIRVRSQRIDDIQVTGMSAFLLKRVKLNCD